MDLKQILDFLTALKDNNSREWMDANKPVYHAARDEFKALAAKLIEGIQSFDEGLVGLEPKQCIFRLNRDIRFSKDKSPYKLNFGASMCRGGRNSVFAGYYLHLMPGNNFIGGGIYMPQAENLKMIRQEIDYNAQELSDVIEDVHFREVFGAMQGDRLKTAPKGYPKDHPQIELLKHKSFIFLNQVDDKEVVKPDFVQNTLDKYRLMSPFVKFLNRSFD